jgi:uncharacterized protein
MGNPVVHFEIRAGDTTRQKEFYSELFGWSFGPEDASPLRYSMVDTRGEGGIQGGVRAAQPGPTGLTFYVQVADLPGALERAAALGAATVLPPTPLPRGGRFAVLRDPEGNELGLIGA